MEPNTNAISYGEFVRRVATVFAIAVALYGLWYLREIVLLSFLSIIIALVFSAPAERLHKAGVPRNIAIGVTVASVLLLFVLFLGWLLPVMVGAFTQLISDLPLAYQDALDYYSTWRADRPESTQELLPDLATQAPTLESEELISQEQIASFLLPGIGRVGSVVFAVIANLVVITVISLFFLIDPHSHVRGFMALIPVEHHARAAHLLFVLRHTLRSWLTTLAFSMTTIAVLVEVYLGLILGIPNSVALALLAAALTIIPNIGAAIPFIPITIFTLSDDPSLLPFAIIGYFLLQQIESNVITPLFIRSRMQIPPASLFLFQIAATALFGFLGLLLAVPLLSAIIAVVRELYVYDMLGFRNKFIQVMLGANGITVDVLDKSDVGGNNPTLPNIESSPTTTSTSS